MLIKFALNMSFASINVHRKYLFVFWVKFAEYIFLQINVLNDFYNIRVKNRPYDFSILKKLKTYCAVKSRVLSQGLNFKDNNQVRPTIFMSYCYETGNKSLSLSQNTIFSTKF